MKKTLIIISLLIILFGYIYLFPYYKYESNREINSFLSEKKLTSAMILKKTSLKKDWKRGGYFIEIIFKDEPKTTYTYLFSRYYDGGPSGLSITPSGSGESTPKHPTLNSD